jgi:hypothetical protein
VAGSPSFEYAAATVAVGVSLDRDNAADVMLRTSE